MPAPRYLFVLGELGPTFTIADEPTPDDLEHAKVGTAFIIRLPDLRVYSPAGLWLPVPAGVLGLPALEGAALGPVHGPPRYFEPPPPRADTS